MSRLTRLIREDREYLNYASAFAEAMSAPKPLPIAVNGLSGGAQDAFIIEAALDALNNGASTVMLLVSDDAERDALTARLTAAGINCRAYKRRELVFHNINASREIERERLSVLSELSSGKGVAMVTAYCGASIYDTPRGAFAPFREA